MSTACPPSLLKQTMIAVVLSFLATPNLQAQDDSDAPSYPEIVAQIRKNEASISKLYSSIPLGFQAKQNQHLAQIAELKSAIATLREQKYDTAIAAFRGGAHDDPVIVRAVLEIIADKLEPHTPQSYFDPQGAGELAKMMLAQLPPDAPAGPLGTQDIAYLAFRASFATESFDRADSYLKKIETANTALPKSFRTVLEHSRKLWERESKIRQRESADDDLPQVKFETSEGDFIIELYENQAPQTVGNFISLVEDNFYDGLSFFRVQPGVHAQTGCKNNNGSGDAGYKIPSECDGENPRSHFSGTLSMTHKESKSGSSQFSICHQSNPDRDGKFTAFGRVTEGLDVVFRLHPATPQRTINRIVNPSTIIKATVIRKRNHPYVPTRIDKTTSGTIPSNVPPESPRDDAEHDKS